MTRWRSPAVMLAAAAAVLSIALGIRHGFGLFLQPMSLEFGWGREVFALAIALQNLVWGAAQPVTGMLADRFGATKTMVGGTALYVAGLVLMSVSSTPGALYLSVGVLLGLGLSGTTFAVVLGAVSRAVPPERRSRAMGIATVLLWIANYFVSQTFPMLDKNRWLIDRFNHAFPFWLYAALCLAAIFFVARWIPETKGRSLEEIDQFWLHESRSSSERG